MPGEKARGKQPRNIAKDALLKLQALHNTHREATRLFLMAVRQAATDAQIVDGKASLISLILLLFKAQALGNRLRGVAHQRNDSVLSY